MGCRLSDFTAEGPWKTVTIHGHKVEMVRARYKSGSIKDLGTSYKVDGKFMGHMPFGNFDSVRESLTDDLNPTKVAAQKARHAEVEAEMQMGNRIHWMAKEVIEALSLCADALTEETCPSTRRKEQAKAQALAVIAKIKGLK